MRLTKTDVSKLAQTGYLEEQTIFPNNKFVYCLQADEGINTLQATFEINKITILVSKTFIKDWPDNDVIGLDSKMPLTTKDSLYLLIEKDFVCLDESTDDQSDNFENPNKIC